ncbi:DUF1080 domain-containing protein [Reichenbachiella sp. MALMAid0571]|uniref:3-keto-disaccharide hydrolase n=1 Tax=Reichenbachiella sp. MALMAid0571 TaxID=3143939 RepID=UPI0032DE5962
MKKTKNTILCIVILVAALISCVDKKSKQGTSQSSDSIQPKESINDGWEYLFDGKTFNGWEKLGGDATYRVNEGMIVGTTAPPSDTSNTFLVTKKNYDNFVLEFEVFLDLAPNNYHNSGVQIRSHSLPELSNGLVHGYQVEIDPDTTARSGGIYDEGRRGWVHDLRDNPQAKKAYKPGEWNHFKVIADGPGIKTWVNGVPAANYTDNLDSEGFIGLQVHATDSDKPLNIKWRNIRVKLI